MFFLLYEISASNTKYLGLKVAWWLWMKMMMQENSKLISSHRHTDVTAIYGTISGKKTTKKTLKTGRATSSYWVNKKETISKQLLPGIPLHHLVLVTHGACSHGSYMTINKGKRVLNSSHPQGIARGHKPRSSVFLWKRPITLSS